MGDVVGSSWLSVICFLNEQKDISALKQKNMRTGQHPVRHSTEEPHHWRQGGTRLIRDIAKEFATTHPNMERRQRIHDAAAFLLRSSGTP